MMRFMYYSCPFDGGNMEEDGIYILDISPRGWSPGDLHLRYRNIFPGSIIHSCGYEPEFMKYHTGIKYHLGEQ